MKIIIVSNRLPIKVVRNKKGLSITRSEGGLATGLGSLETELEKYWVGWPGIHAENEKEEKAIEKKLSNFNFLPVFLSEDHFENYYEGYSNSTIWPLCHYFYSFIEYKSEYWEAYQQVNKLFFEKVLPIVEKDDIIWVQDYQLMLLPKMIREKRSQAIIGYFHHIPFPSYELFRVLPEREEILEGLLGADLIGFHTHDYMRHFISAVYRVLDLNCSLDEISLKNRIVHVDAFPMGINYDQYHEAPSQAKVIRKSKSLRKKFGENTIILSVDRLDYSKGIVHRLNGFAQFLENHPEFHEKVSMAMVVVPSRDNVGEYAELKHKIDQTIGELNGKYSKLGWIPVYYFYRSFPFEELMAMYDIAEVALVSPLRDGMNLVAKEYLATKSEDNPGVLILSEMAGAATELQEAIIINPNDTVEIENAILKALNMDEDEKKRRLSKMQEKISTRTVQKWAQDFVGELNYIKHQNKEIVQKVLGKKQIENIRTAYEDADKRLIVLDYDGTLSPFVKNPDDAKPSKTLIELLKKMVDDKKNKVLINSGRNHKTLDEWFKDVPVELAAEHGAFFKKDGEWINNLSEKIDWDQEILDIIKHTIEKTPNSFLEVKDTALVWHFRSVDIWLAELREQQLINAMIGPASRLNLQVVPGNKIVEVKPQNFNKGSEIKRQLEKNDYDFIMAMGDDTTDEDMFRALPPEGISIKVGNFSPAAKYRIPLQSSVIPFLKKIIPDV